MSAGLYDLSLNEDTDTIYNGKVAARKGTYRNVGRTVSIDRDFRVHSLDEIDSDEELSLPPAEVVSETITNAFC
jgi:hypothetical protein